MERTFVAKSEACLRRATCCGERVKSIILKCYFEYGVDGLCSTRNKEKT